MTSEMRFQSLEHGVPDVIVEPAESEDNLPVLHLDSFIEQYLSGVLHIHLDVRSRVYLKDWVGTASDRQSLGLNRHVSNVPLHVCHTSDAVSERDGGDFPVLIPVGCFMKQPEKILVHWTFARVWAQVADIDLSSIDHESDSRVSDHD